MMVSGLSTRGIDDAQAQLALAPALSGAGEAGRQIALKALLRNGAAVAEQAETDGAVGDDGAPARRIAAFLGTSGLGMPSCTTT